MTILTYSNEYYHKNYSRRSTLVDEYKSNMMSYLTKRYPTIPDDVLDKLLSKEMKDKYIPTNAKYLSSPSRGNIDFKDGELLYISNALNEDILTPSSSTYVQTSVRKSLFTPIICEGQANRSIEKGEMLLAEARGDEQQAKLKYLRQLNIKTEINILSGVMLSNVAFRSAINYNSITSTVRFSTTLAYSTAEMMLEGNLYLDSESSAITWLVNLARIQPDDKVLRDCICKYELRIPSADEVSDHFCKLVNTYSKFSKTESLRAYISELSDIERAYVYYACNMKHIFQKNPQFDQYLTDVADISNVPPHVDKDITSIYHLKDPVVFPMTLAIMADEMMLDGKSISLDVIDERFPELRDRIMSVYHHVETQLSRISDLLFTLVLLPIAPSEIMRHINMIRKTTLLSDTDSIMFTTIHWVEWFTGQAKVSNKAANVSATIVGILCKIIEHTFAYSSASMNMAEDDIKELCMENEYNYDIFLRTDVMKHYAGFIKFREGLLQVPYKFDLKGGQLKGSSLCKTTTAYITTFIKDIFNDYLATYKVSGINLLSETIRFEQRIKQSIHNGDCTFLAQQSINLPKRYKNPDSSVVIYYYMWDEVFTSEYPEIHLPQKCLALPIPPVSYTKLGALDQMKESNPDMYDRFVKFLAKYPKRSFDRVMLPMDIDIPKELRPIVDYRRIVKTNCSSIYMIQIGRASCRERVLRLV